MADLTLTKDKYLKTLILRVSADEDVDTTYKVHLVPYFGSHESACQKWYTSIHKVKPDAKGGLIGWLGERETLVDSWINDNPFGGDLDKVMTVDLKLEKLTDLLCKEWPR